MSNTIKQAINSLKGRIADAYTAIANKGGTLPATQDSANLPTAIASIPAGGGGEEPEEKDVLFIDYDGTIIASYTYDELETMTVNDFPTPPTHEGLTFVRWTNGEPFVDDNYVTLLQQLKTYKKKITLVGAIYKPIDGFTHIFIQTFSPNQTFVFYSNSASIDVVWDAKHPETIETLTQTTKSHTYTDVGEYEIILKSDAQCQLAVNDALSKLLITGIWANIFASSVSASHAITSLSACVNLKFIVTPAYSYVLNYGTNDNLASCASLKALISENISGGHRCIQNSGVKYLIRWFDASLIGWGNNCRRLRRINFPINPTNGSNHTNNFESNHCLQYIWLNPNAPLASMAYCYGAREIFIPHAAVPTLSSTSYFSGIPTTCVIHVKSGLLEQYTGTNWAAIRSQYQFVEDL